MRYTDQKLEIDYRFAIATGLSHSRSYLKSAVPCDASKRKITYCSRVLFIFVPIMNVRNSAKGVRNTENKLTRYDGVISCITFTRLLFTFEKEFMWRCCVPSHVCNTAQETWKPQCLGSMRLVFERYMIQISAKPSAILGRFVVFLVPSSQCRNCTSGHDRFLPKPS